MFPRLSTLGLQLIGIAGNASAGKDTIGLYIHKRYQDTYAEHFADPLKRAASEAFGIPLRHFTDPEFKEEVNDFWGVSPRQIAQFLGTEMFRETMKDLLPDLGPRFWIKRNYGRLRNELINPLEEGEYKPGDTVVIPDVRFQEEIDYIEEQGGVIISVIRPDISTSVGIENHPSEATHSLNFPYLCSYQITNNGTLDDLSRNIRGVCNDLINHRGYKLKLRASAVTVHDL